MVTNANQGCQEQRIYLCFPAEYLPHDRQRQSDDFCLHVVKISFPFQDECAQRIGDGIPLLVNGRFPFHLPPCKPFLKALLARVKFSVCTRGTRRSRHSGRRRGRNSRIGYLSLRRRHPPRRRLVHEW